MKYLFKREILVIITQLPFNIEKFENFEEHIYLKSRGTVILKLIFLPIL
jgi:hypothetical protein